ALSAAGASAAWAAVLVGVGREALRRADAGAPQAAGWRDWASALGLLGLGLGLAVALGTTAGVGGASRILGVLRREELDLRGPGYAVVALVTATGCGYWAAARRLRNGVAQAGTGALCVFAVTCLILADGR